MLTYDRYQTAQTALLSLRIDDNTDACEEVFFSQVLS